MRAKIDALGPEVYNPDRSFRNVESQSRFDGVLPEALSGQVSPRLCGAPESFHQGRRPLRLRPEAADRLGDRLGGDAVLAQVVPDELVPVATVSQGSRPGAGEPFVVDVPDALERLERVVQPVLIDPCSSKALLEIAP